MARDFSSAQFPSPASISTFRDTALYAWPKRATWHNTTYSKVASIDDILLKLPSPHGFSEYQKYVVREERDSDAIRGNEPIERIGSISELIAQFPTWKLCRRTYGDLPIHWLLLHKLQFERLAKNTNLAMPVTAFIFLRTKRIILGSKDYPALVQERIPGVSLWQMIDHHVSVLNPEMHCFIREEYREFLAPIAEQLRPVVASSWSNHINWHIMNFIFQPETKRLFYVDLKPSNIFGRWRNEQNLRNIRRDFLL
jgi:hypothetical protein